MTWRSSGMPRAKVRPRHTQGKMNKTEAKYGEYLDTLILVGEIKSWRFERFKIRFGRDWNATFMLDFWIIMPDDRIEIHDVKGTTRNSVCILSTELGCGRNSKCAR